MRTIVANSWDDYELLDSGLGRRLERFGRFVLDRPDPQALWQPHRPVDAWNSADATFVDDGRRGQWERRTAVPESWPLASDGIVLAAKLTPFKHTGIFPEQRSNWQWLTKQLAGATADTKVLNLFGYTGGASLVAAKAGASVTHVDASRPTVGWARDNQAASGLADKPIRWILDDALKFVAREERRGGRYDAILMDPPVIGHGPNGEPWDFAKQFPELLDACARILTDRPRCLLVNAYAISASAIMLENMLGDLQLGGTVDAGELALQESGSGRLLSTGLVARWQQT